MAPPVRATKKKLYYRKLKNANFSLTLEVTVFLCRCGFRKILTPEKRIEADFFEGKHEISGKKAYKFLQKHLYNLNPQI